MREQAEELEQEKTREGMQDVGYQLTQQMLPAMRTD
jgi:hypothetical protein